jgi:Mn-dependent DtxR family transcriptional regulator
VLTTSRQTVNKELRALARNGVVNVTYGCITIRDLDALRHAVRYRQ